MTVVVPDWVIPTVAGSVIAFVVTSLGFVLKNRRNLLSYHVTHDRMGISTFDKIHGKIEVTVGGNPVQNLYMSNIWLVNRSMRDVEDLVIKVFCRVDDMRLMTDHSHVEGTVEFLKYTAEYEAIERQFMNAVMEVGAARAAGNHSQAAVLEKSLEADWERLSTTRWYAVPVLARGQTIRLTYMTNVLSDVAPEIFISCQKAGVRVKYKQPYQPIWHLWEVSLVDAGGAGVLVAALVWIVVNTSISTLWIATLICLLAGLLANIPGAAVVRFYRWLRNRLIG